jgi:hypothetical protein
MTAFQECPVCGAPIVITESGLAYCPACEPQSKAMTAPCPVCHGSGDRPQAEGQSCPVCAGSGVSPYLPPPAAIAEHWGYLLGLDSHERGLTRDDSPFLRRSDADQAWRLGWARADRDAVTEHYREKEHAHG